MMCQCCKFDGGERIDGIALCPSCRERFTEPSPIGRQWKLIATTPRAVRPQSLARERYESAHRTKERLR